MAIARTGRCGRWRPGQGCPLTPLLVYPVPGTLLSCLLSSSFFGFVFLFSGQLTLLFPVS